MLLVDVSKANSSAQAIGMVEDFITHTSDITAGERLEVHTGNLLLTQGILTKIKNMSMGAGLQLATVYSTVPQTQQAALDEGLFVKEKPQPAPPVYSTRPTLPIKQEPEPPAPEALAPQTKETLAIPKTPSPVLESSQSGTTLYLKQTVRSGKVVRFEGNIVIIGDVHAGSEITATGDIAVWGELRGIAHAGAQGDYKAEIRALKIEAIQLRIADYIARRPDRIYYHKEAASAGVLAPELAKVADGEIKIFQEVLER